MKVGIAYLFVVLIWSTTPLAIKWSNSSLTFVSAITLRVFIALIICYGILFILRRPLIQDRGDWQAFCAALIGLFPNMLLVYWSAQHIPSGLAAVIFGLYPFMVGFFSMLILHENIFSVRRVVALCIAFSGLVVINIEQLSLGGNAAYGVLGMIISTTFFGLSSVWLKKVGGSIEPIRLSAGTLLLATPLFLVSWYIFDGEVPTMIDSKSGFGVMYLALAGTIVGGCLFFFVLRHCRVSSVGLITFMTPLLALALGVLVDGERFSLSTMLGCILVLISLGLYQDIFRYIAKQRFIRRRLTLAKTGS